MAFPQSEAACFFLLPLSQSSTVEEAALPFLLLSPNIETRMEPVPTRSGDCGMMEREAVLQGCGDQSRKPHGSGPFPPVCLAAPVPSLTC